MTRVGIIGLGYVGSPLAAAFAEAGVEVRGYDVDSERVAAAQHIGSVGASGDASVLTGCDAILICVPTPLDADRKPDLSAVVDAVRTAASHLGEGTLVVLESTTYPGTTREVLQPILEATGRRVGTDVFLAYAPERVDPGNDRWGIRNTPRVIGGVTAECARRAEALYRLVCDEVRVVSSPETAEMAKLVENTFRAVNIAFVNELAMVCHQMGIDVWETIDAASTKPFGYMPFWPGPGLGGHCIPIDPFYLSWRARQAGAEAAAVELAGRINIDMPQYAVDRIVALLEGSGVSVNGSRILLLGVAYKPDVGDVRESPSLRLIGSLREAGADVAYHDPHVPQLSSHGLASIPLSDTALRDVDLVVIATDHSAIDLRLVVRAARHVFDLRNAVRRRLGTGVGGPIPSNVEVL